MFSHIMVGANDIEQSKAFYDAVLGAMGCKPGVIDQKGRCFYFMADSIFAISKPINDQPACHGNGSTIGFAGKDPATADALGMLPVLLMVVLLVKTPPACESPKGALYLAYLRDPSGNKICALYQMS